MNYGIHNNDPNNLMNTIQVAKKLKCTSIQTFLGDKIKTTLKYKYPFTKEEITEIKKLLKENNIDLYVHGLLTLNFCNDPQKSRYQWGLDNLIYDLKMGQKLGIKGVTIHAGRYNTKRYTISPKECYQNYINSLIYILDHTKKIPIFIETPATKKNTIINSIEEFSELYKLIPEKYKKRIKICIDTCHIFVSDYNISHKEGVLEYFDKFDKLIGLKNVKLIHLNDSYGKLGSHLNRHSPLSKGYIFKNYQDNLTEIIKISNKYKIPMILETDSKTFNKNIKLMKESIQFGSGNKNKNKKELILQIFQDLLDYHKTLNNSFESEYRISSYEKIIKELQKKDKIVSINDISNLNVLGKKSYNKIKTILETNHLPQHNNIKKNLDKIKILKSFQNIYGIGPTMSKKLYKNGIKDINDLKKKVKSNKVILTNAQKIALNHYNNLKIKIPYHEITNITNILKKDLKKENIKCDLLNAGSYAMKKAYSGDIDYICVFKEKDYEYKELKEKVKNMLVKNKYFVANLLSGSEKDIYLIKINKNSKVHQMDIGFVEEKHKYFYILYFSSSREFSKKIRIEASKKGYKLNEKGLYHKKSGKLIDFQPKSEKDIFDYLHMNYIKPENRF